VNILLSVVLPVYNADKYLSEAINSIINQTYKNFELIIINDGSTDKSLDLIENYKKNDERIVLISRENKGLVASLNEAINKAKGEYIVRMDADDICFPSRFEEQLLFMIENDLDLCGSSIEIFRKKNKSNILILPEKHNDILFRTFFFSSFAHPSTMIKKKVFKYVKYENEVAEDYRLWCDIISKGFKVGNINKVLLKYRIHDKQITQTKSKCLINSVNNIAINFAKNMDKEISILVKFGVTIQNENTYKEFKELFNKIIQYSKRYNVEKNNLYFIIGVLYSKTKYKSLLKYYLYLKATRGLKKDYKKELIFLLRSVLPIVMESYIYGVIRKLNRIID